MARPREFDEVAVVDRARTAFWCGGVAATSINDLCEATGLTVGSVYKAFKNKDGLYRRTLEMYLDAGLATAQATLAAHENAIDGIDAWLDQMATQAASDSPTRGCYAVQAAIELAGSDSWVRDRLRRHDDAVRFAVAKSCRGAISAGDLVGDASQVALVLCSAVNGVQVEARKGISLDDARSILTLTLRSFRP